MESNSKGFPIREPIKIQIPLRLKIPGLNILKHQSWIKRHQVGETQSAENSMVFHGILNDTGWTNINNDIRLQRITQITFLGLYNLLNRLSLSCYAEYPEKLHRFFED